MLGPIKKVTLLSFTEQGQLVEFELSNGETVRMMQEAATDFWEFTRAVKEQTGVDLTNDPAAAEPVKRELQWHEQMSRLISQAERAG